MQTSYFIEQKNSTSYSYNEVLNEPDIIKNIINLINNDIMNNKNAKTLKRNIKFINNKMNEDNCSKLSYMMVIYLIEYISKYPEHSEDMINCIKNSDSAFMNIANDIKFDNMGNDNNDSKIINSIIDIINNKIANDDIKNVNQFKGLLAKNMKLLNDHKSSAQADTINLLKELISVTMYNYISDVGILNLDIIAYLNSDDCDAVTIAKNINCNIKIENEIVGIINNKIAKDDDDSINKFKCLLEKNTKLMEEQKSKNEDNIINVIKEIIQVTLLNYISNAENLNSDMLCHLKSDECDLQYIIKNINFDISSRKYSGCEQKSKQNYKDDIINMINGEINQGNMKKTKLFKSSFGGNIRMLIRNNDNKTNTELVNKIIESTKKSIIRYISSSPNYNDNIKNYLNSNECDFVAISEGVKFD